MSRPPDCERWAFSTAAPWVVAESDLVWRRDVDHLRAAVRAQVPALLATTRWPPVTRGISLLGAAARVVGPWMLTTRRRGGEVSRRDVARRLREGAERLGPTYIKLGQIISSGSGLFPEALVAEFAKCRDQVPAESFATVRQVMTEELDRPLESIFAWIDPSPLAAASIAQVHAAELSDGTPVVVKVQRPGIERRVRADVRTMSWLAPHLIGRIPIAALANPPALVQVFAETIVEELDFRLEADNMLDVARTLAELGHVSYVVPRPHPRLVTARVLVMERLDGFRFDDIDTLRAAGIDTHDIIRTGMIGFMEGCLLKGVFHGDLHGGNLFVRRDGTTVLLDFGITGRLDTAQRLAFLRLMVAGTMGDVRGQVVALCDLGALPADTDIDEVIRELGLDRPQVDPTTLDQAQMVAELQRVVKGLLSFGARLPKELMLFVKNLVFLDGAIAVLAPDLDLIDEVAAVATHFATVHGSAIATEIGMDPATYRLDLDSVKDAFGVDRSRPTFTYRELQARRELIKTRLRGRG